MSYTVMMSTAVRLFQYAYVMFLAYYFEQIVEKFKNLEFREMCLWLLATNFVMTVTHFELEEFSADNMDLDKIQKLGTLSQIFSATNQVRRDFGRNLWFKVLDIAIFVLYLAALIQHPLLRSL